MHLLISIAGDVTSDLLCKRLAGNVLRVNWERWKEYDIEIRQSCFRIADHFGRAVTEATLENIIWRKPVKDVEPELGEGWYCFYEFKYAVQSIMEWARQDNPRRLPIDPAHNSRVDKFKQLRAASRYFPVPKWAFTSTPSALSLGNECVAKSLTGQPIPGTGELSKVIYTSLVNPNALADGFPWFVQQKADATQDLTVVFVDGKQFGFLLDRSLFHGLDWRQHIGKKEVDEAWKQVALPASLSRSISSLMADLGLRFGRLDLLSDAKCENVWFLEVNPNGQWAWLDLEQTNGLFDGVVEFLTS
jgi:hypothetical protein